MLLLDAKLGVQSGVYTLSSGSKLFRGINTGLLLFIGSDFILGFYLMVQELKH